jgi:hypothetical protein
MRKTMNQLGCRKIGMPSIRPILRPELRFIGRFFPCVHYNALDERVLLVGSGKNGGKGLRRQNV